MELSTYFRSIIDQDKCAVVICNLEHEIIYMNPAAIARYKRRGGAKLIGTSLLNCHNDKSGEIIRNVIAWFEESAEHNILYTSHNKKENKDVYMVALRDENASLIGYYEKHEYRNVETDSPYNFT